MARKVTTVLIDDLTGENADETVEFGIDGKLYEIELTADNASRLRELLAGYVKVARRAESPVSTGRKRTG
ncbi:MAG TPA: Lsr2 family protein, partial [Brevibacterium ravenspurgense]|nr:Lsr2 family protein [Brevibacterium ravenspurgense]